MSEQNYSSYPSRGNDPRRRSSYPQRSSPSSRGGGTSKYSEPASPRPKKPKRKRSKLGIVFRVLGTLLLIALVTGAMMFCFAAVYITNVILPNAQLDLGDFNLDENSVMLYWDKNTNQYQELGQVLSVTDSQWVDYEDIPQHLKDAAVAIEDQRFWTHHGVDWKRTAAAVVSMFTGGDIQGGSTITQQLIKNLTSDNETTVKRKVTEIFRALEFDKNYGKETTLEWYLNVIPLGSGCKGVGAASYEYFGKPVSELTLAESASLIGITNNPSKYGPYSTAQVENRNGEMWSAREWNKYRQEVILNEMLEQGYITQAEHDEAVAQELVFQRAEGEADESAIYSWYEEQVITDVMADLKDRYDYSDELASRMLATGGLKIYTCIDPAVQAQAEAIYENRENLNYSSKKTGQQLQSAITIIDNQTGDIAAVVGRMGVKDVNRGYNLATNAKRQPGSSIKPLTVYAPAVEMGLISPISVMPDYPYKVLGGKAWPVNVDGRYRGQVTMDEALANSYNTIAVRVMADLVTPTKSYEFATQRFHLPLESGLMVNGEVKSDVDIAPLSLGGLTTGVTTRDMANAFSTFPNNGVYRRARTYTRVEDSKGNVLLDNSREDEVALKETTAYYMNSMLTNVVRQGGGTEAAIRGMTVAGKTGTTDSKFDRYFVGYTPYYTAAVWVGYEQNERVSTSGINPAAQMFKKVMAPLHEGLENKKFPQPGGLITVHYCMDCGGEATEACTLDPRGSRVASAAVFAEDRPASVCTCHNLEEGGGSLVRVCVDDPVLDANGAFTGFFHTAGPFCPEVSIRSQCYLNLDRPSVGGAVAEDNHYLYSMASGYGPCRVHTTDPNVPPPDSGEGEGTQPEDPDQPPLQPENPDNPDDPSNPSDPEEPPPSQDIIDPIEPEPESPSIINPIN